MGKAWRYVLVGLGLGLVLFLAATAYVHRGPLPAIVRAPRPSMPRVADADNAFVLYRRAVDSLPDREPRFLYRLPDRYTLTDEYRAFLSEHEDGMLDFLEALLRPKCAIFPAAPSMLTDRWDYSLMCLDGQVKGRALLALEHGEPRVAGAWLLSYYRFGTELSSPPWSDSLAYLGILHRERVAEYLPGLLARLDTEALALLVYGLDSLASRDPSPEVALQYQIDYLKRTGEDMALPRGDALGYRTYQHLHTILEDYHSRLKDPYSRWDVDGVKRVQRQRAAAYSHNPYLAVAPTPWRPRHLAEFLASFPGQAPGDHLGLMLRERAQSACARALAIAELHRRLHGKYPSDLASAARALEVEVPCHPADKTLVQYRLEKGRPVVSLQGVQGREISVTL